MICEEFQKKDRMNKKILVDLSECYLLLIEDFITNDLIVICVPCLLKVALKKEENEETRKEAEMALLALSCIRKCCVLSKELYLNEVTEIIDYHQGHSNPTRLAYQSAWDFLMKRLKYDDNLEDMIVNDLHFWKEAIRELEELRKSVDWKRIKENEKKRNKSNETLVLLRWLQSLEIIFVSCQLWYEEFVVLIGSIVRIFRVAKNREMRVSDKCVFLIERLVNGAAKIEDLLKSSAFDVVLSELVKFDKSNNTINKGLWFFKEICWRLKFKMEQGCDDAKIKELKRKVFERMEEEGYEDCVVGLSCYMIKKGFGVSFLSQVFDKYCVHL
eukprot:MONOS_7791.1-p1 / transcript=MONOS_7791.1 / gene=MONOS_7791 / organism=Monocercomonoides_exilis_PA203 / gene_product=unspecified product / transcript_product=unspecified product / location=Mono_scaffold00276:10533-11584(-) / protein_length=329 / sequence_SO=supercontig / SO=protein_coding / is_pseudo=false